MKTSKIVLRMLSAFSFMIILDLIFNLAEWQVVIILLLYCMPWMVKDFQEDLKKARDENAAKLISDEQSKWAERNCK